MSEPSAPQSTSPEQAAPAAPAPAPVSDLIDIEHFMKVKLRVARVIHAEPVPKSKKLLRLEVDLGETLGKRQIVSGIALFYTPDQLIGRRIVVVANLKPAALMGVESQGMLLAGSTEDNSVLALIEPHESLPLGATIR